MPENLGDEINCVLFDLDDTLLAFDAVTEPSWRQVCAAYCRSNESVSEERLYRAIMKHSHSYWSDEERHRQGRLDLENTRRYVVGEAFKELDLPQEDSVIVADHFSRLRIDNMYLLPGAVETLSRLKEQGTKLGLLTNGDSITQRGKIHRFDLGNYFGCILVEGELGYGKPDERVFLKALEALESKQEETVMVGDNLKWDIAGPQAIGIRGIWYNWKGIDLPKDTMIKPYKTIRQLPELLEIVLSTRSGFC